MVDNIQANAANLASLDIAYVSEQLKGAADFLTSEAQDLFLYAKQHPTDAALKTAGGIGMAYVGMKGLSEAPGAVSKFANQIGFPNLVPDGLLKEVEKPYDLYAKLSDRIDIAANPGISQRKQMQIVRAEREPAVLAKLSTNPNLSTNAQVELINRTKNLEPIAAGDDILLSLASRSKLHPTVQDRLLAQPGILQDRFHNGSYSLYFEPATAEKIAERLSANVSLTPKNQLGILDRALQPPDVPHGELLFKKDIPASLLDFREKVVGNLAYNPSITRRVRQKLLEQATELGPDMQLLEKLGANPKIARDLFRQAEQKDGFTRVILEKLTHNPATPVAALPVLREKVNSYVVNRQPMYDRFFEAAHFQGKYLDRPSLSDTLDDVERKMLNAKAAAVDASRLPQEASIAAKGLRVIGTYGGLVPLVGLPAYSAYEEWKKGGSNFDIATSAGKGFVDGLAPGASSGYSDVIGSGDRTYFDRFLNGLDHATGTAAAIGGAAVGIEALGVVTAPAAVPTAFATGVAVIGNVGVNVIKAGVKVSGYAGSDQDGGYIYEGGAWVGRQGGYAFDWAGRQISAGAAWVGL
jgi:hypothetical protein